MQQVRASGDELRFAWQTPGPVVVCTLGRGPKGAYEGDCIDQDGGDRKHLALRPPVR